VIKKFVIETYETNKERDIRNITQVMQACNNKIQNCYKQVKLLHQYKLSLFRERIRLPKSSGM
jgi:hypothetical protein